MDNLKQKIDAEIGGLKWNDALTETIHKRANKKSFSAHTVVTFCTIALACFLLVLNLQPADIKPDIHTGEVTSIQIKEMYVADADWPQDSFHAKQSTLYIDTKKYKDAADLQIINKIIANMQPISTGYPSYFDFWIQKDLLLIDANDQPWRMKFFIFDVNSALIFNIDTGEIYEYKNEELGPVNPLNNAIFIFNDNTYNSNTLYIFCLLLIIVAIQFIFKFKYNVPFHQKIFEDSKINKIVAIVKTVILILFIWFFNNTSFTFIPAILFILLLMLSLHLLIVYRYQTKLYFIRELLTNITVFTFFSIILFTL